MTVETAPSSARTAPLLVVADVVAGYTPGVDILTGVTLHLGEGELVGIIGPNGAGKSTLVKAAFGLVPVRSGRVELRGDSIVGLAAHQLVERGVGYVPQVRNVFSTLSVADNLRMGAFLRPAERDRRVAELTELFPILGERREERAGALSGGQRQLLAMARALMMEPSVLLLDEPSAGLSPIMQDEVFGRIVEINRSGVSILIVEQNAHKALAICDRGYVLDDGREAHTGRGSELLSDPKVIELYLGSLARDA